MPNRVFVPQVVSAVAPDDELYIFVNNTTTQRAVYEADGVTVLSQPLVAYSDLTFDDFYILDNTACTLLLTSQDGAVRPGFPVSDVYPSSVAGSAASGVSFSPIEGVAATDVQAAIVAVAGLAGAQPEIVARSLTPWSTGGTGDAFTITPDPPLTAYGTQQFFLIRPDRPNTISLPTLNVNGLGQRQLRARDSAGAARALLVGEFQANRTVGVSYDGVRFYLEFGNFPVRSTTTGAVVRHSDGSMVVRRDATLDLTTNAMLDVSFPDEFAGGVSVSFNATQTPGGTGMDALASAIIVGDLTNQRWRISVRSPEASGGSISIQLRAEGRWF